MAPAEEFREPLPSVGGEKEEIPPAQSPLVPAGASTLQMPSVHTDRLPGQRADADGGGSAGAHARGPAPLTGLGFKK